MVASPTQPEPVSKYWPSARHFTEVIQCPTVCFSHPALRNTLPAVDRLGMPIVTSGQFAYVYKLKSMNGDGDFAVRCFRGYLGDRDQRYRALQEHVQAAPVPYLSEFRYAPEGIMVGGKRFPILFMKWIDGPTLDLYVNEMLQRREVLAHLSEEWLRVVSALQQSGMAHGDLQHGNVIVEHGQLRLIDHDGIYVPAMKEWSACEVGHQHYQHPHRTAQHFDANLDNFSALVIYVSLLSLAERPELWQEYHDENLLFTKADFADPSSSTLFARIRDIGGEPRRLADVLAEAAIGPPNSVPRLLDLVHAVSRLPSWMTAPLELEATTKTREVARKDALVDNRTARWISWDEKPKERPTPVSASSSTVQTIFGAKKGKPKVRDPNAVVQNTMILAVDLFRSRFIWWWWLFFIVFQFGWTMGLAEFFFSLAIIAVACLIYGFYQALQEKQAALMLTQSATPLSLNTAPPAPQSQSLPGTPKRLGPFVGNRVLGIFHEADCPWVMQISAANLINFRATSEASSHGYKPCRVCLPAS